jgi:hypothetical protein
MQLHDVVFLSILIRSNIILKKNHVKFTFIMFTSNSIKFYIKYSFFMWCWYYLLITMNDPCHNLKTMNVLMMTVISFWYNTSWWHAKSFIYIYMGGSWRTKLYAYHAGWLAWITKQFIIYAPVLIILLQFY